MLAIIGRRVGGQAQQLQLRCGAAVCKRDALGVTHRQLHRHCCCCTAIVTAAVVTAAVVAAAVVTAAIADCVRERPVPVPVGSSVSCLTAPLPESHLTRLASRPGVITPRAHVHVTAMPRTRPGHRLLAAGAPIAAPIHGTSSAAKEESVGDGFPFPTTIHSPFKSAQLSLWPTTSPR